MSKRYVIISPCRNEAKFMRETLESVTQQTVPPEKWVIVDDGSTDETPDILAEYASRHEYIHVISRTNRGSRDVGPGVIDAFYTGLETVDLDAYDYVCKLDLDLELPSPYFQLLMEKMEQNPRIGTCSGKAYYRDERSDNLISENIGDEMSLGMSKFYRCECFRQIDGFVREVMWDGIDCHRCRMMGWIACSWDNPELRFVHLRPMGSSQKGILSGRMRHGRGQYFMGTSLAYMTASAIYRMANRPLIVGAAAMWWGYLTAMLTQSPRYDDAAFRKFLRTYQWKCLLKGKQYATWATEKRQSHQWRSTMALDQPIKDSSSTSTAVGNYTAR